MKASISIHGVNSATVYIGNLTLDFSYRTCIAYHTHSDGFVIRENDWSTTTGEHLNLIDPDHSVRIPGIEFERKLNKILRKSAWTE